MTLDAIHSYLASPVGLSCLAIVLLLLMMAAAPAPRRPIDIEWSLGCLLIWVLMSLVAAVMIWPFGHWNGAWVVFLCGWPAAASGFWLARAPWPHMMAGSEAEGGEPDDSGGGGGGDDPPVEPPPRSPSPGIDWDAFDRARDGWSRPLCGTR